MKVLAEIKQPQMNKKTNLKKQENCAQKLQALGRLRQDCKFKASLGKKKTSRTSLRHLLKIKIEITERAQ